MEYKSTKGPAFSVFRKGTVPFPMRSGFLCLAALSLCLSELKEMTGAPLPHPQADAFMPAGCSAAPSQLAAELQDMQ